MTMKTVQGAWLWVAGAGLGVMALWAIPGLGTAGAAEEPFVIPAPAVDVSGETGTATALFAAGCFWGVQGVFQHVNGVVSAVSGYAGGAVENPSYEQVTTGSTGHAEAVEVKYDPSVVSYGELLHILFSVVHNPTQLNYQGPDEGTQYRSAIFPMSAEQEKVAAAYIEQLDKTGIYGDPVVTAIEPFKAFYPAEAYHQDFMTLYPDHPYIAYWDAPKLENFKRIFAQDYREKPALVGAVGKS